MSHENITDITTYLRAHATELGERILETYPPLQSTKDPLAPRIATLLRKALPAQALAITGTAKYLRKAKAARIVAECGAGKTEVVFWIEQGWLQASIACHGKRRSFVITPEALMSLYKHHHSDVLKRGIPNQALFEAYVQYCFSPKHTIGEQLLEVRRDKRERAAFAATQKGGELDDEDDENDEGYRLEGDGNMELTEGADN